MCLAVFDYFLKILNTYNFKKYKNKKQEEKLKIQNL